MAISTNDVLTDSESYLVIVALRVAAETGSHHLRAKYRAMADRLCDKVLTASPRPASTAAKWAVDLLKK